MIRAEDIDREPVSFTEEKAPLPRDRRLQVLPPKRVIVEKTGKGVRVTVTDRAHDNIDRAGTSAVAYHVHWAETVDATSEAGVAAGFTRSTLLAPALPAPGFDGGVVTGEFTDPKYATGYFYVTGVDERGRRSEPTHPVRIGTGSGGSVPDDVRHFQASESGEVHNGTTLSIVSYSFQLPERLNDLDRVQFWYQNYPNLNELSAGESVQRIAGAGGSQTGKLRLPVARRMGSGTISIAGTAVTGVGTNFLSVATGSDYLEVFGYRALISSVTSNTSMTLAGAWPAGNPAVSGAAIWQVIGAVIIYAVSIGQGGERRDDVTGAPGALVWLDGELSTPNAPTLAAVAVGNAIRLEVTPPAGTELARLLLYRATGAGVTFSKATCSVIHSFEIDRNNATQSLQWDDSDFTTFQREQSQTFSYFATAVNARDQESSASSRVEASCRLDSPAEISPPGSAREIALNLLYNGHINGTDLGAVGTADAGQEANMGGAPAAGWYKWDGSVTGVGSAPGHENTNEVVLAMTGAGVGSSIITQQIDACDHGTAANRRVPTWKPVVLQVKARTSGGQPDGWLALWIEQYNGGSLTADAALRQRASDDSIDTTESTLFVFGDDITTDHRVYHGVFLLDPTVTTTHIVVNIAYGTFDWNSVNIYVTEAMLSIGENLPQYTPQMVDPAITWQKSSEPPPPVFTDRDGSHRPFVDIQTP